MSTPYSCILDKVEEAVAAMVASHPQVQAIGWTVFKGLSVDALGAKRIEIVAGDADPERHGDITLGNYIVNLSIAVVTESHDGTREEHRACAGAIADLLMRDDIEELLGNQNVKDFSTHEHGWTAKRISRDVNDMEMVTRFEATLYCRPSARE